MIEIVKDERGSLSAARVFLAISLVFTGVIIVLDSTVWEVPESVYSLLGGLAIGLVAWAGGPRVAQYLGPQVAGVASGIAQAIRGPQRPDLLDNDPRFREHDEG